MLFRSIIGYTNITDRASSTSAIANLRQLATAAMTQATVDGDLTLDRDTFLAAMSEASVTVTDGLVAAETWTLFGAGYSPAEAGEYAIGFDTGPGSAVGDATGTRAAVLTADDQGNVYAVTVAVAGGLEGTTAPAPVAADDTPTTVLDGDAGPAGPTADPLFAEFRAVGQAVFAARQAAPSDFDAWMVRKDADAWSFELSGAWIAAASQWSGIEMASAVGDSQELRALCVTFFVDETTTWQAGATTNAEFYHWSSQGDVAAGECGNDWYTDPTGPSELATWLTTFGTTIDSYYDAGYVDGSTTTDGLDIYWFAWEQDEFYQPI